jgi:hypothetical protein
MATSTRLLIRQTAAARLSGLTTGSATSSVSAPSSTFTDNVNLLDSGDSNYNFVGEWVMFTEGLNAGDEKRIGSFVASAGTGTVGNPFDANIVSGDDFEIQAHLAPSQWNICINAALRKCTRRREEAVAIVTAQNQYSLAALTDLTRKNQIIEIMLRRGAALKKTQRALNRLSEWEAWEDDDAITLNVVSALTTNVTDSLELVVAYIAPYAALSTDAATTTCDLDWVVEGTLLQAMMRYRHAVEEPAKQNLNKELSDFEKEFRNLSMKMAPQRAKTIGARFV